MKNMMYNNIWIDGFAVTAVLSLYRRRKAGIRTNWTDRCQVVLDLISAGF